MYLMIDHNDSFVYNLIRYFKECKAEILVISQSQITIEKIHQLKPEGIILSPGPKSPSDFPHILDIIEQFKEKIPFLGICLGHQILAHYFGAFVTPGVSPIHGKISTILHNGEDLFFKIPLNFKVTRYHSLIVAKEQLPTSLDITALSEDGVVMGIKHATFPIFGVQFHPEAELTEYGHHIIDNFIKICKEVPQK